LSFQLEMVKITVKDLQIACEKQQNILEQAKAIQVDPFVQLRQLDQDEFFEKSLGLIYSYTRTREEEFWLWAHKEQELVAFVWIKGNPQGVFVVRFEGTAQW